MKSQRGSEAGPRSSQDSSTTNRTRTSSGDDFEVLDEEEVRDAVVHRPVIVNDDLLCFGTLEKVTPYEKTGSRTRLVSNAMKNMAAKFGARKRFFILQRGSNLLEYYTDSSHRSTRRGSFNLLK
jgi:hypothetical protein